MKNKKINIGIRIFAAAILTLVLLPSQHARAASTYADSNGTIAQVGIIIMGSGCNGGTCMANMGVTNASYPQAFTISMTSSNLNVSPTIAYTCSGLLSGSGTVSANSSSVSVGPFNVTSAGTATCTVSGQYKNSGGQVQNLSDTWTLNTSVTCGSSGGKTFATTLNASNQPIIPATLTSGECQSGYTSFDYGTYGSYDEDQWLCYNASAGGTSSCLGAPCADCNADTIACGPDNGKSLISLNSADGGFCEYTLKQYEGGASPVTNFTTTGSGWTWNCVGADGSTKTSCSATKVACVPNNCGASTCTGQTYSDGCGGTQNGTMPITYSYSCSNPAPDCTGQAGQTLTGSVSCTQINNCTGGSTIVSPATTYCGSTCTAKTTTCPSAASSNSFIIKSWKEITP
jgi:hypothetical protein